MRHQRAAAGWSSGRGPAAAANRTSRVASKPARVSLFNLSTSSGIKGPPWRGGLLWQQVAAIAGLRRCQWRVACRIAVARLGGVAELGWPGGSQVAGVDMGGGAPHLHL